VGAHWGVGGGGLVTVRSGGECARRARDHHSESRAARGCGGGGWLESIDLTGRMVVAVGRGFFKGGQYHGFAAYLHADGRLTKGRWHAGRLVDRLDL
jgi:hypothetical protein